MQLALRNYLIITGNYWSFTLTDGAIRMLVLLYFHRLGYSPFEVALLFLFYEFFGIVTNLVGGWLGTRIGLNKTMHLGMALQVIALLLLTVPHTWLSVAYVMFAQALSGIAKDLNKMSAKAGVKILLPHEDTGSRLFKWIALLTGSKNALKGLGFFLGAGLMQWLEFRAAIAVLALGLFLVLITSTMTLPVNMGKTKNKNKFIEIFSKSPAINWLSAARFFLFAARDVWFVVALPVYLYSILKWDFIQVGGFIAFWFIGYGLVQASAPKLMSKKMNQSQLIFWAFFLTFIPAGIAYGLSLNVQPQLILISGLIIFAFVFAINSALHSYFIVALSPTDKVSMNVGFYYMANAGGRLMGTVLSGWIYQSHGLQACLYLSSIFVLIALILSIGLQKNNL